VNNQPIAPWLAIAGIVVAADQALKWLVVSSLELGDRIVVLPVLSWVRWHNDGAAFSMLAGSGGWQRWFFVALAIGFSAFLIMEMRRLEPGQRLAGIGYGLIMGGALGNMIDRLSVGYVVDFVLVHWRDWYFPAFNVADAALTVGAALWLFAMWQVWRAERARA
jgi:signal peptidase II